MTYPPPTPPAGGRGERFGESAARLCHAAAVLLGWRPEEFWNATPAELALALKAPGDEAEGMTLEQLKRRFPDESMKNG
ncbi:MAG: phage tail assembly chaperone [Pseudomonadota bacterium]